MMATTHGAVTLLFIALAGCSTSEADGYNYFPRSAVARHRWLHDDPDDPLIVDHVVGGRYAKQREISYQAFVQTDKSSVYGVCGGAIISKKHVLTAKHCLTDERIIGVEVFVGHVSINRALRFQVDKIYYYEDKGENIANDIAILKIKETFPLKLGGVKIVPLQKDKNYFSKNCVVSGWGETQMPDAKKYFLKLVRVPMQRSQVCKEKYSSARNDDVFCAGLLKGGRDACQGDSGGPLVCEGHLTGVVKGGYGCGLPKYPGTYTQVAYYYSWINSIIHE